MNQKEIRWRQRFENFHKAYGQLQKAVFDFDQLNLLEKEGLVQRFEYTFELAWKTLKDYLEANEVIAKFPRDVIKEAFRYELIQDGDAWMDMLESRNTLTHTYNEDRFNSALTKIKGDYYTALSQVHHLLHSQFEKEPI
ncbi:nucleotidyltransferase substrate binding protein [Heliophilum fasciatum]|uniref:Nucleotidyltransferase substrate binding protein (TIGR01987 family) n=1 Tax=Heliophilum fasciatum TaxID=35700 RepID=A0A4R2RF36_9FIRM|nr:nucleotidyltransferase substrate binding protein [Heliophilum fasciatum]MCW2279139.1 nucleotidyltransferase substrate binding protein (TIGR01987 family) [Heliophilum fasciatum]TCP61224.1 nucleotidyltransferase substrate binding protein (TIGR01987 family) [Heliophilum fasciatum]